MTTHLECRLYILTLVPAFHRLDRALVATILARLEVFECVGQVDGILAMLARALVVSALGVLEDNPDDAPVELGY